MHAVWLLQRSYPPVLHAVHFCTDTSRDHIGTAASLCTNTHYYIIIEEALGYENRQLCQSNKY